MQGKQLLRGSALSSCFAKRKEPGQGTDPALDRALLRRRGDSTAQKLTQLDALRCVRALQKIKAWNRKHAKPFCLPHETLGGYA